jgi:hypothetical protein
MFSDNHLNNQRGFLAGILGKLEIEEAEAAVHARWRETKEAQEKQAKEAWRMEREEAAAIEAERDLLSGGRNGAAPRRLASSKSRISGLLIDPERMRFVTRTCANASAGPLAITPRARPERRGFDPARYDYRPDLFARVHDTAVSPGEMTSDSGAFEEEASTMGYAAEPPMSMTVEQRAAWQAGVKALTEAEAKKQYPGEGRTYRRIKKDAGRGECVLAERWRRSFKSFLLDVGPKPETSFTLDRLNPLDPVYGPDRCAWRSPRDQANNRTTNVRLTATWKGQVRTLTIAEWAALTRQPAANVNKRHQRRKPGVPDWCIIREGAGPAPADHTASPAHPPPPGWERCPAAFARLWAEVGRPCPPRDWAMHYAAFQRALPTAQRSFASVPVFLAWHARERVADAEHVLLEEWAMRDWAGTDYVPRALVGSGLLRNYLTSRAILADAEAMLTDAEREFLDSRRLRTSAIVNRHREPIRDEFVALRAMMKFAKAPPSADD